MSEYFTPPADIIAGVRARSAKINAIIQAIEDGFDELPTDLAALKAEVIAARDGQIDLLTKIETHDVTTAEVVAARDGKTSLLVKINTHDVTTAEVEAARDGEDSLLAQVNALQAAIAALLTTNGSAVSANDTTPGYLNGKLIAGAGVSLTENNDGGNETLEITAINSVAAGMIVMWSGAIVDIPATWALCDGTNGTPDLRNKFIVGAGDIYAVAGTGGSTSHSHSDSFSIPAHTHTDTFAVSAHTHADTFSIPAHDHADTFAVAGHTLTEAELASHTHSMPSTGVSGPSVGVDSTSSSGNVIQSGATGSNSAHTHTLSGAVSSASITLSGDISNATSAITGAVSSASITLSGAVSSATTLPPYYALAYIMKL